MAIEADETAPYDVTEADTLWLRRAVQAEGPPQDDVAATLVNGFMLARSRGFRGPLHMYIRAYAQPVNPEWFEGGSAFERSIAQAQTDEVRQVRRTAARSRQYVHSVRSTFTKATHHAVDAALSQAPRDPRSTDYAGPEVVRSAPWVSLSEPKRGQNRFWTRPNGKSWNGYRVTGAALGGLVAILLLGAAAYVVLKG